MSGECQSRRTAQMGSRARWVSVTMSFGLDGVAQPRCHDPTLAPYALGVTGDAADHKGRRGIIRGSARSSVDQSN